MSTEDRLGYDGKALMDLPEDRGDQPALTEVPYGNVVRPQMASSGYSEGQPLPDRRDWLKPKYRAIGRIDISDVISPNRFRRVYRSVRVGRNELYTGPVSVVFMTHVGAMMAEELSSISSKGPTAPANPGQVSATTSRTGGASGSGRNTKAPTAYNSRTGEYVPGSTSGVPQNHRTGTADYSAASPIATNSQTAERYAHWNRLGGAVGKSIDVSNYDDALQGEGTDDALETLGEIVRPRSWVWHTVLNITYPLMEVLGDEPWWQARIAGENYRDVERKVAMQHSTESFPLMAGSTHGIKIPYPVGTSIPISFDVMNNNSLYAANVNMSVMVYVERGE
ncbi:MAG: hypothetical protein Q4G26_06365 [Paracoccus sp. (in: a-proteobacteria)]|nr:hypothetical protein [Paracoccus sp. (in: a-proteobacteria)]